MYLFHDDCKEDQIGSEMKRLTNEERQQLFSSSTCAWLFSIEIIDIFFAANNLA